MIGPLATNLRALPGTTPFFFADDTFFFCYTSRRRRRGDIGRGRVHWGVDAAHPP